MNFHAKSAEEVLRHFHTKKTGLTNSEVEKRLEKFGKNELPKAKENVTRFKIFLSQFKSPLIIILIVAGTISGFLGAFTDMAVIFITVAVNTFVGFIQEDKANQALKKLREMVEYKAVVLRDGHKIQVNSNLIVKGDILVLEAGDKIQADGRIIEAKDFYVNEAVLTGESEPQSKHNKIISEKARLAEKKNMVFRSSIVTKGRAMVVVTAIGGETEIGQIASLVKETKQETTPLQKQLSKLAKVLGLLVIFVSGSIFALGIFTPSVNVSIFEMFEMSVAIAVALVPEGLVISLTVILAIGMQHILRRRALVRKLVAAETLGSVSVICTDKTGTLTEGKMNVTRVVTSHEELNFEELGILEVNDERHADVLLNLKIGVIANDGVLQNPDEDKKDWSFVGDTTDVAFVRMGMNIGLEKYALDTAFPRQDEIPFDSDKKYMATMHYVDHETLIYVKGAAEKLYEKCAYYEHRGEAKKMTAKQLNIFKEKEKELAGQGLRVLATAYKIEKKRKIKLSNNDLNELVFVGLTALSDPLRADVVETVGIAQKAGIKIIMITGDHLQTARHIATEINIPNGEENIFDGQRLEEISDEELKVILKDVTVFARVDPKHKIRIVQALQAGGEVVAMTGDGVNDAPALKGCDIGVAVGSGTDVAKEIADLVILDDNFKTIVAAVEEGRGIYQNIKKVIVHLLAGNLSEVFLIIGSILGGLPLALLPVQILWMNLVQGGVVVMAYGFDKGDKENMDESPKKRTEFIIDKQMWSIIGVLSIVPNLALFGLFIYYLKSGLPIELVRTIMFVGIGIGTLFYIFSIRSMRRMIWRIDHFNNKFLIFALSISWTLLLGAIYLPWLQKLLRTVPLGWEHWSVLFGLGLLNIILIEIVKKIFLARKKYQV